MVSQELLGEVLKRWQITIAHARDDLDIAGSPNRTKFRATVEDTAGRELIVEQIAPERQLRKQEIAWTLDALRQAGMEQVDPYLPGTNGEFIQESGGRLWQLRTYTPGVELPRPSYIYDRWRGTALTALLLDLRRAATGLTICDKAGVFSIRDFVREFMGRLRRHRPDFAAELQDIVAFLEDDFMPVHDELPLGFCHGDYHPLNVIWGADGVNRAIDWEFCGRKPELYDVALMTGCFGMENPEGLTGGAAKQFLGELRDAEFAQPSSWRHFLGLMVAIRFAWLQEWFRHENKRMIEQEAVFMRLLINNTRLNKHLR